MCFSAQVWADYRKYIRHYNAKISIGEFLQLLKRQAAGERINMPKGLRDALKADTSDNADAQECRSLVLAYEAAERSRIEAELFTQRHRLVEAERKLAVKHTKAAAESQRIANNLIGRAMVRLDDLKRTDHKSRDDRIYSGWYCPVMVLGTDGQPLIRPMRYQCRVPGVPASFDKRYPGCYNAKRSNLEGFWQKVFAHTHAVIVAEAFLEHVDRHKAEGRELAPGEQPEDIVIQFAPGDGQTMLLAALWAHWKGKDEDGQPSELVSFSIVTDEPPPEVAMAGHDRCPVPLKRENIGAWLAAPSPADFQALLDDRERPYYAHQLAAVA